MDINIHKKYSVLFCFIMSVATCLHTIHATPPGPKEYSSRDYKRYWEEKNKDHNNELRKQFEKRQQIPKKPFIPLWTQAALVGTISFCTAYSLVTPFSQDRDENMHAFMKNAFAGAMSVMGVGAFDAALRLYQDRNNTK